jgi:hypothetical protein
MCGAILTITAGQVVGGFLVVPFLIAIPLCYAMVSAAWGVAHLRVASLRTLSLSVGAGLGGILAAVIPLDAAGRLDLIIFGGPPKDPNRLPIALPIAVVLVGIAFVIGRRRSVNDRDANALLAIQVPMVAFCVWLAGRTPTFAPAILLCGAGLVVVVIGVLFAAPRIPFLADEDISSVPVGRPFVAFSLATTAFALAAPLMIGTFDRSILYIELVFAAGVLPLSMFSVLQRSRGALSLPMRGIAYGCAFLFVTTLGSLVGFLTVTANLITRFGLPRQALWAASVFFSAVPSMVLGIAVIYWTSHRRPAWHEIAPVVALHLSWICPALLIIPNGFVGLWSDGQDKARAAWILLMLSAAASIAALVSARAAGRRAVGAASAIAPLAVGAANAPARGKE